MRPTTRHIAIGVSLGMAVSLDGILVATTSGIASTPRATVQRHAALSPAHRGPAHTASRYTRPRYRVQESGPPILQTAPASALAVDGVWLTAPPADANPAISAAQAAQTVGGSEAAGDVREVVLATDYQPNSTIAPGALVWEVSTGSPTQIAQFFQRDQRSTPLQQMSGFVLGTVDATTGHFYGTVADGTPMGSTPAQSRAAAHQAAREAAGTPRILCEMVQRMVRFGKYAMAHKFVVGLRHGPLAGCHVG